MKVTTAFGAFLDPVADKIMVSTVLVLLAVSPPEPLSHSDLAIPVVIMIGREITMSALREWAASLGGGAHKVRASVAADTSILHAAIPLCGAHKVCASVVADNPIFDAAKRL